MYASKEIDGTNPQTAFVTRPTKTNKFILPSLLQQNMTI
jgi:hypothetical protein